VRLLLDTHVWFWAQIGSKNLRGKARRYITSASSELWLSPVSVWELALLHRGQQVEIDLPFEHWVRQSMQEMPLYEAPMTFEVALDARGFRLDNNDPADRLLAATARVNNLVLVTADEVLLAAPDVPTLDAS